MKKPLVLTILDGYGNNPSDYGNAIKAANTPNLDRIFSSCPVTEIGASGMDVGLPDGQMGNSEVGHTNIGAGRVVYQELTRITKSIKDGDFFGNAVLTAAMENCKNNNKSLHIMGLLSDGGVHSHNTHLYALLDMAKSYGLERVYIHAFLDGRDVPPTSGRGFLVECDQKIEEIGVGKIATVMGRYYAMDRDTRWERVEKAYAAMVCGRGIDFANAAEYAEQSYANDVTDEFVLPGVSKDGENIRSGDSVVFFNFRPDRAREITRSLVDGEFAGFVREQYFPLHFVCMTTYDAAMPGVKVAFAPQSLDLVLGEYISKMGLSQLRIAETTKYAHVTFFFNGGRENPFSNEDRVLIDTPDVATFDLKPEMSAFGVADEVVSRIKSGRYDVIILNYANCDMVGHTGIFDAAVSAVEAVDQCVGMTVAAVKEMDGIAIITADHGNADQMYEPDGSPFTAHTTYPVPFAIAGHDCTLRSGGKLADIAPTMLMLLGLDIPAQMDGKSLIIK
ncbi:MAG: 2,3-bisphosphoglycerate-independent phosphoglycerate mutase [Oscillospiraceae bacterium]|nr:2,3-bisphosphoglycerate-independent phosphoglycerate mutase [Oscillospiraceae bacterium]